LLFRVDVGDPCCHDLADRAVAPRLLGYSFRRRRKGVVCIFAPLIEPLKNQNLHQLPGTST
jgi:hypothetical protein